MPKSSEKSQIRGDIKKHLKDFLHTSTELHSLIVQEKPSALFVSTLCSSELYTKADIVLAYASMPEEAPTADIIARCLADGKKLALPKIKSSIVNFFFLDASTSLEKQLSKSAYGIDEPIDSARQFFPELFLHEQLKTPQNILVIVPAIAFSKKGHRLGRGGGFYDRYLARLLSPSAHTSLVTIHLCGMCYSFQILDTLPCEKHDVHMQYILSEKELIVCTSDTSSKTKIYS